MAKWKGFALLYFIAEFWLTSQQVLRIGKQYICPIFFNAIILIVNINTAAILFSILNYIITLKSQVEGSLLGLITYSTFLYVCTKTCGISMLFPMYHSGLTNTYMLFLNRDSQSSSSRYHTCGCYAKISLHGNCAVWEIKFN